MTWQRIDENTYIDDTLVTCAEYQLFIDEMREQGKYYQPDHWTSYQFPIGQAREPILGVRPSDAKIFCEWLTNRELDKLQYRLPSSDEASYHPFHKTTHPLLGYWINGANDRLDFVWVRSTPSNFREIDPIDALNKDLIGLQHLERAREFTLAMKRDDEIIIDINDLQESALNMDNVLVKLKELHFDDDLALDVIRLGLFTSFHPEMVERDFHSRLEHILYDVVHRVATIRLTPRPIDDYPLLFLYIDILTLQERIGGRSPAFEGIRLVKERIR